MRLSWKILILGSLMATMAYTWWAGPQIPARLRGEWAFDEPAFTDALATPMPGLHQVVLRNRATNGLPWVADIRVASRGIHSLGGGVHPWNLQCSRVVNRPWGTIAQARSSSGGESSREVMLRLESSGDDLRITVEHEGQPGIVFPFHRRAARTKADSP